MVWWLILGHKLALSRLLVKVGFIMLTFCYSQSCLSFSPWLCLSYSYNPVVQSSALQLFFWSIKWQSTNMPFSSVFCSSPNEKAMDVLVRDYRKHTNTLLTHTDSWQALPPLVCHAWWSTQMKGQAHQHPSPPQTAQIPVKSSCTNKQQRCRRQQELQ